LRFLLAAFAAGALLAAPVHAPRAALEARSLAFRFILERQIVFPMVIDGQPAEAWLDSGASVSVVDSAFARRIGLELGAPVNAHGVGGQVSDVRWAQADLLAGDLAMAGRHVVVMDLSAVQRKLGRPVEVLLGRDVFDKAVVDIDFQAQRIRLTPRADFAPPAADPLPLQHSGELRSVPIAVGGVVTPAIFDLGNAGGLLIDRQYADRNGFLDGHRLSTTLGVGAEGAREDTQTALDGVKLGDTQFDGVPTAATPNLASEAPANVGLQLLSRFRLTIDFGGDRIWLSPYADAQTRPFRKNRAGLSLAPDAGRLVVDHVARGSPAERAGWRAGEAITALDGRPIPAGFAASESGGWVFGPAGRTVSLTLADGQTRKLTLADYY